MKKYNTFTIIIIISQKPLTILCSERNSDVYYILNLIKLYIYIYIFNWIQNTIGINYGYILQILY